MGSMGRHKPRHHLNQPDTVLCQGKRRYASRLEAESVRAEQELLTRDLELAIYRCVAGCGGWHLTRRRDQGESYE